MEGRKKRTERTKHQGQGVCGLYLGVGGTFILLFVACSLWFMIHPAWRFHPRSLKAGREQADIQL
jgi:hypothetical protein